MKAIFIILLLPFVAEAFYKGIPYKQTEICEKIKADASKALSVLSKHKDKDGGLIYFVNDFPRLSKAFSSISKALNDANRYRCFKQTPACSESLKDATKAYADGSRAYAGGLMAVAETQAFTDKKKALANIKRYCKKKVKTKAIKHLSLAR